MKECPSCGAMVPKSADRCKECFHDFNEAPARSNGGPIFLLASVAAMAVVAAGVLWYITSNPIEEKILVDEETHSVVWTRSYRNGVETDRLPWEDIAKLEYVIRASGGYEITAVTTDGDRRTIQESPNPLKIEADHYAQMMEKPLDIVDNTRGFHKMD